MIIKLIQMLIILVSIKTNCPVHDLRKKPTRKDHLKNIECILRKYSHIFIALFLLAIFIVFTLACFSYVGASGVESGNYYYHLKEAI